MDSIFNKVIQTILDHEGRGPAVNNSNDPGGLTRFGISQRAYPNLDIKNLTIEKAIEIYYKDYWMVGKYYNISNLEIATKIFDCAVNMGSRQAGKLAQRACIACGKKLVEDGILGRNSFKAISRVHPEAFIAAMKAEQWAYYRILISRNSRLKVFYNGWKKRAYS